MRGFVVTGLDGERIEVEATRYEVAEDGAAHFFVDDAAQATVASDQWERIDEFGTPLSAEWPSAKLDAVLARLSQTLGVTYGYYVHLLGNSSKYAPGYFNDVGALTSAILAAVSLDHSSDSSAVNIVVDTIKDAFDMATPVDRLEPSGFMTDIHCPRCGDTLFEVINRRRTLECRSAGRSADLSEVASDRLRAFVASAPNEHTKSDSTVNWGGTWFCPADGMRMSHEVDQLPACSSCTRILPSNLVYQLIEIEFQGPH